MLVFEKKDNNNVAFVHNIGEQLIEDRDHPLNGFQIGNGMNQIKHILDTDYDTYLIIEFCQDDIITQEYTDEETGESKEYAQ